LDPDPTASERHVTRKPSSSFAKPRSHTAARNVPDHTGVVRVAAIQMASGPNVSANLAEAERLIQIAVDSGAKLVALPENFAIMGVKETDKINVREEPGKGPIQKFLGAQAKKHGIWLIGGSVPLECGNARKVFNSCLVYDDKGKQVARYDKIHLFGLDLGNEHYREETTIKPGHEVVAVESPFGRIGLSICYDLRFPELYRAMGDINIIVVPAAFTADLYFQYQRSEAWSLEEGIVKSGSFDIEQGVGVRAISGEKTAFAYSDDISLDALVGAATATRAIAAAARAPPRRHRPAQAQEPPVPRRRSARLARRHRQGQAARTPRRASRAPRMRASPRSWPTSPAPGRWSWWCAATATMAADVRPLVRVSITVIMEEDGRREQGSAGGGGRYDYGWFSDDRLHDYARQAVHQARVNLGADPAPAGTMTGGARARLARHPAARGDRPRPRGRLQPQGQLGLLRAHRPARGRQGASPWSTTARYPTAAARSPSTTRATRPAHRADRGRHPHGYLQDTLKRAPDGRAPPATAAANPSPTCRCRA
jgi:predicted amidohydrolase